MREKKRGFASNVHAKCLQWLESRVSNLVPTKAEGTQSFEPSPAFSHSFLVKKTESEIRAQNWTLVLQYVMWHLNQNSKCQFLNIYAQSIKCLAFLSVCSNLIIPLCINWNLILSLVTHICFAINLQYYFEQQNRTVL